MQSEKWEYACIDVRYPSNTAGVAFMNIQGEEGWELVSVDGGWAYFKRPKNG